MDIEKTVAGLRDLADLIERNKDAKFTGTAFISPPEGDPIVYSAIGNPLTQARFFEVLTKTIIAAQEETPSSGFVGIPRR